MTRAQIPFPDPLYEKLKAIARRQELTLAEVMQRAAEQFAAHFPEPKKPRAAWKFPVLKGCGDFLTDPATLTPEADAVAQRAGA